MKRKPRAAIATEHNPKLEGNLKRVMEAEAGDLPSSVTAAIFRANGMAVDAEGIKAVQKAIPVMQEMKRRAVPKKQMQQAIETHEFLRSMARAAGLDDTETEQEDARHQSAKETDGAQ